MPSTPLLLWVLTRALLLPYEPATFSLIGPGDYPAGTSVAGLIETGVPAVTSERFDASGAGVGTAARIGAYGESWTETTYRIGDVEVTSPLRPGTPMVLMDATGMSSVSITASGREAALSTPGVRVTLDPMRPGQQRAFEVEGVMAPASWAAAPGAPPAISSLHSLGDISATFSGPVRPRLGLVAGVHLTDALSVPRGLFRSKGTFASAMAHLVATPRTDEELRVLFIAQRSGHALDGEGILPAVTRSNDTMGLAHVGWERRGVDRLGVRVSAGYQVSALTRTPTPALVRIDSVLDGAVLPLLLQPGGRAASLRSEAVVAAREGSRHRWRMGASVERHTMEPELLTAGGAVETVNGRPARVWVFDTPASAANWRQTGAALFAEDRVSVGRLSASGSVRVERLTATNGGAGTIKWSNVYPSGLVNLTVSARAGLSLFAGASAAGGPIAPLALALGDPSSPSGRVYRWNDANLDAIPQPAEFTTLVARVGPGAWAPAATGIAANLRRPKHRDVVFGLGFDREHWTLTVTGMLRRQTDLLQLANAGAAFTRVDVADEGIHYPFPPPEVLDAYSRTPESFGLDTYVLTNPDGFTSEFDGLDASFQIRSTRASLAFGATAARTSATTTLRGFRVTENDPGLLDYAANPNGLVNAVGRPFFDRGYTGKIAAVLHLPGQMRLGTLIRYQDGQPFSRLADVAGLAQGPEPISAYPRGRTRFTYVGTVDVRLQKTIGSPARGAVVFLDVFNLFDATREVEELVSTTPAFRNVSAVEPPRTARLGLRLRF